MSDLEQSRDHLFQARLRLLDAELALAAGNPSTARIEVEVAQAHISEARRLLLLPPAPLPATSPQP